MRWARVQIEAKSGAGGPARSAAGREALPIAGDLGPRSFLALCAAGSVAWAAYHVWLAGLMRSGGLVIGAFGPGNQVARLVPLYMHWQPHLKTGLAAAALAMLAFLVWMRAASMRGWRPASVALGFCFFHVLIATCVALVDGGFERLARPYRILVETDYVGAVDLSQSARALLGDYARRMPELPLHCQTHPPGAVLFLWCVGKVFGGGAWPAALATILAAALASPAVYLLARAILGAQRGALAAGLFVLAPSVAVYSATCMDAVFMTPMIWAVYLTWTARERRPKLHGALAGICVFAASLMTFSVSFIGLWIALTAGLSWLFEAERRRPLVMALAAAAVALVASYALLVLWSGYDLWGTFESAVAAHHRIMAGQNHATVRQHAHLVVANAAAFFFAAGLAQSVLWARSVWRDVRPTSCRDGARLFNLAFLLALATVDLAPLYTLEVEHIWLFIVPLVSIGACSRLSGDDAVPPVGWLAVVLVAAQTLAVEVCLETIW